MIRGCS